MASSDAAPDLASPDPFSAKQAAAVPETIPATGTAVIVVDLVNDYLDPGGAMPMALESPILDRASELVAGARAAGARVVWVRPGHTEGADGLFRKRIAHAFADSWGAQIHPALPAIEPGERVVCKRRYSAFFATDLDLYLREHRVTRVVIAGVALNICVRSTVHDAFFLGYDVWVATDASQATSARERESTRYDIETHFGHCLTTAEILGGWS
jgi:ureidoacrylate peracid hydrolase